MEYGSAFDLAPKRSMVSCSRREWSVIMDGAKYSGLCVPFPKDSRFICFAWAATANEIIFRPAVGEGEAYVEKTIQLSHELVAKPLVAYSDGPYCFIGNQLIGPMGFSKTIHLAAQEEPVEWCMFDRSHFLLATNLSLRSIIIKSSRQVDVELWTGSWLSAVTLGWFGRSLNSLAFLRTSLTHNMVCAVCPDGDFVSLAPKQKKVLHKESIANIFGHAFSPCGLAVTDEVVFVAARGPHGLAIAQLRANGMRSVVGPLRSGSKVLLSAVERTCVVVTEEMGASTVYVIEDDVVEHISLDVENISAVQLHPDCLSFAMMTDNDVVERPVRLRQDELDGTDLDERVGESAEALLRRPLSRAVRAKLSARPMDEVVDAVCTLLGAHPPIRGFVINSLTNALKRAKEVIEVLQQAGFFAKKNERLLTSASQCLERLQGAIILRKLQDVYPEPFVHAMASIDDKSTLGYLLDTQELLEGLIDYTQSVDDAASAVALVNGICAEYLNAIVKERESGMMRSYLGDVEKKELLIQNSLVNEGSPAPVWYAELHRVFLSLCESNSRGTSPEIVSKFRSFASSALRAFVTWEHFSSFRNSVIATLWKLEEMPKSSLDLAEQYEAIELLTRMTVRVSTSKSVSPHELRLYSHLEWSPRLRRIILEYLIKDDHIPEFCAICDKFAVGDDVVDSLLQKYPTYRWAVDLRRKRNVIPHCEKVATHGICSGGNRDTRLQDQNMSPAFHAALARISAFANSADSIEGSGFNIKYMPCWPQLHIDKLYRKYLDKCQPFEYSSYLQVLDQFTDNLRDLAQNETRSELFHDIRDLIGMIEEAEFVRVPDCVTIDDALRRFWLAIIELDREQLMTVAGASEGTSEQLIASILAETAFGILSAAGPELPRSAKFLLTTDEPDILILRPALLKRPNQ